MEDHHEEWNFPDQVIGAYQLGPKITSGIYGEVENLLRYFCQQLF